MTQPLDFAAVDRARDRMRAKLKQLWLSAWRNVSDDTLWELARAALIDEGPPTNYPLKGTIANLPTQEGTDQ